MASIAERVAAGVAYLDTTDPDWWRTDAPGARIQADGTRAGGPINLNELRMRDQCNCVLGQRLGSYYLAEISMDAAIACGFDTAVGSAGVEYGERAETAVSFADRVAAEFDALTDEWARVISGRREVEARRRVSACCPCRGLLCDPGCACPECPHDETELTDDDG